MKKKVLFFVFIVLFVALVAVIYKIQSPQMQMYRNNELGYEFSYPKFWTFVVHHPLQDHLRGIPGNGKLGDSIDVYDPTPLTFRYRPDITVTFIENPENLSVSDWVNQYKPLPTAGADFKPLPLNEQIVGDVVISGFPAKKIRIVVPNTYIENIIVTVTPKGVYHISDFRFTDFLPFDLLYRDLIINKIVNSFHFL